jgi:peptide/nickel transport system substrate-binding protein
MSVTRHGWWIGVLALLATSGCGIRGADHWTDRVPLPPDTLTEPMAETGVHGGRFVAGVTSGPKTFNPLLANDSASNELLSGMFIGLTDIDYATQEDVPALAKSWEFSADGLRGTFHLRRGACFSDGHPITSDDVVFSYAAAMDTALHSNLRDALVLTVGGQDRAYTIAATDSYTVVATAPGPDALMLSHLSSVRIVPKHVLERAWKAGTLESAWGTDTPPESLVTSGPWRLASNAENQQCVLERNPYWFGVDARGRRLPYLDQLVYRVARDQDAAAQMFHAGELDGLDNVKAEDYARYRDEQKSKGFTLHDIGPSFSTYFFWFNLNRARKAGGGLKPGDPMVEPWRFAWFGNRDFRRAVSMAVDRDAIIRGPLFGYGEKNWALFTSGNARWYDSTLTAPDLDVEGAKRILDGLGLVDRNGDGVREDAAGHPVSFTLLYNTDNRIRAAMATLLQDDLARVGIRAVPTGLDFPTLVTRVRNEKRYEACLLGASSPVPADPAMGANLFKSSGMTHYWDIGQPEGRPDTPAEARMDSLFQVNVESLDLAKRKAAYVELARILNDESFVIWLPVPHLMVPVRSVFGNVHPSPMRPIILWNSDRIFRRDGGRGR